MKCSKWLTRVVAADLQGLRNTPTVSPHCELELLVLEDWGYTLGGTGDGRGDVEDKMDTHVGIYRDCQDTHQIYFYDKLVWGTSYSDADPDNYSRIHHMGSAFFCFRVA
jgi:hypothetical protein